MSERVAGGVTALVVNFNAGDLLLQCVDALMASDLELAVTVVDNGSTDSSLATLRAARGDDPALTVIEAGRNLGFAAAVNRGVRESGGDWLVLVNPDCVVERHAVGRLVACCAAPDVGLAGGLVLNFDGSEQRGCRRREPTPARAAGRFLGPLAGPLGAAAGDPYDMAGTPLPRRAVDIDAVSGSFLCVPRRVLDVVGGIDEGYFLHCEDLELCRAVRERGLRVRFEPAAVAFHHRGASAGTSRARVEWHKHAGMLRYFRRHYRSATPIALRAVVTIGIGVHWLSVAIAGLPAAVTGRRRPGEGDPLPAAGRRQVIVLGATSQVGGFLIPRLRAAGYDVLAVTRGRRAGRHQPGCRWFLPIYLDNGAVVESGAVAAALSLAPIWVLPGFERSLEWLGVARLVALGSTSLLTKGASGNAGERALAERLRHGEAWALARPGTTVLRPTMVYGGANRNVDAIRRLLRRIRCFPLVDGGTGLRQPVHADDVAAACVAVLAAPRTAGRAYNIAGAVPIRYRDMVETLFRIEGLKPRFVPVSGNILKFIVRVLAVLPWFRFLTPEMVDRMTADMAFSNDQASEDFGYRPRAFEP